MIDRQFSWPAAGLGAAPDLADHKGGMEGRRGPSLAASCVQPLLLLLLLLLLHLCGADEGRTFSEPSPHHPWREQERWLMCWFAWSGCLIRTWQWLKPDLPDKQDNDDQTDRSNQSEGWRVKWSGGSLLLEDSPCLVKMKGVGRECSVSPQGQ